MSHPGAERPYGGANLSNFSSGLWNANHLRGSSSDGGATCAGPIYGGFRPFALAHHTAGGSGTFRRYKTAPGCCFGAARATNSSAPAFRVPYVSSTNCAGGPDRLKGTCRESDYR